MDRAARPVWLRRPARQAPRAPVAPGSRPRWRTHQQRRSGQPARRMSNTLHLALSRACVHQSRVDSQMLTCVGRPGIAWKAGADADDYHRSAPRWPSRQAHPAEIAKPYAGLHRHAGARPAWPHQYDPTVRWRRWSPDCRRSAAHSRRTGRGCLQQSRRRPCPLGARPRGRMVIGSDEAIERAGDRGRRQAAGREVVAAGRIGGPQHEAIRPIRMLCGEVGGHGAAQRVAADHPAFDPRICLHHFQRAAGSEHGQVERHRHDHREIAGLGQAACSDGVGTRIDTAARVQDQRRSAWARRG